MSTSTTTPISPTRFISALKSLPITSLHAKIHELRNSIAHLQRSNIELSEYAAQGDAECYEALMENKDVIQRFEERIELVKREITEERGLPLTADTEGGGSEAERVEEGLAQGQARGRGEGDARNGTGTGTWGINGAGGGAGSGQIDIDAMSDEEVQRRLRELRDGPVSGPATSRNTGTQHNAGSAEQQEEEGVFL